MKKITILLILLCSILLFSCSKDLESPLLIHYPQKVESGDSVNSFFVNSENALNTANHFWSLKNEENLEGKKNSIITSKIVDKIDEFKDDENNTIFYIFNYKGSSGFTIVSSDKRMIPILAYSEEGIFDKKTDNPGIQFWCSLVKDAYKESKRTEKIADDVARMWTRFEKQSLKSGNLLKSENCGEIPNILVQHLTHYKSIWSQGTGYNYYCSNRSGCDCGKASIGCGPVAMGQVLKYYGKQVLINGTIFTQNDFATMPQYIPYSCSPSANELKIASLLRKIGSDLNADYFLATNCQTVVLTPSNIVSLFNAIGYTSSEVKFFSNIDKVEAELKNNRPVILYGSNCDICIWNAHIWVLDGMQKSFWYDEVTRYDDYGNSWIDCVLNTNVAYQMNWGWGGNGDSGWYTLYNFNGNGTNYNNANMKAYLIKP